MQLGISRSYVSRIEKRALQKLRRELEDGYCVIIVTHDDALGKRADETIRMQDGQLAERK